MIPCSARAVAARSAIAWWRRPWLDCGDHTGACRQSTNPWRVCGVSVVVALILLCADGCSNHGAGGGGSARETMPSTSVSPSRLVGALDVPDAGSLLTKAEQAMSSVTAARIEYHRHVDNIDRGGRSSGTLVLRGDFVAPDRLHCFIGTDPAAAPPIEVVIIGQQMWTRVDAQPWAPTNINAYWIGIDPAGVLPDLSRLEGPGFSVSDNGTTYLLTREIVGLDADVDPDPPPALLSFGMYFFASDVSDYWGREGLTVGKETGLLESTDSSEVISLTNRSGPNGEPGSMSIRTSSRLYDFNDPSIRVEPPITH